MIVYRASEYGRCLRASTADRMGMKALPPPEWLQKIFDGGNDHEDTCVLALQEDNYISGQQAEVVLQVTDDIQVVGHLDGLIGPLNLYATNATTRVLEIKSPGAYAKFERAYKTADWSDPLASRYAWQISAYMAATGLEAVVACLDGETVRTFGIEVAPHSLEEIRARVETIEIAAAVGQLPTVCSQDDGDGCPFRYLHGDAPEVVEDQTLDDLVTIYESLRVQAKLAEESKKMALQRLSDYLGTRDQIITATSKVTRYTTERRTIDKARMVDDGIDVTKYEKVSESIGLRVTVRGDSDE